MWAVWEEAAHAMSMCVDVALRLGQLQLIRKHIAYELNVRSCVFVCVCV